MGAMSEDRLAEIRFTAAQLLIASAKHDKLRMLRPYADAFSALVIEVDRARRECAALQEVVESIRSAAVVAHKGPHDTDAAMMRRVSSNLRRGFEAGGSNVKQAVARVLDAVADALDGSHD